MRPGCRVITAYLLAAFAPAASAQSPSEPVSLARQLQSEFEKAAERVLPAVVVINITRNLQPLPHSAPKSGKAPFSGLPEDVESQGSGFVVKADGYNLTN
jgi:S1-C subfamily serine protease